MKIILLGPKNYRLKEILLSDGHNVIEWTEPITTDLLKLQEIEFIISYGYQHIIKSSIIEHMQERIINLHISYLPWNKGADPNLWSFLEDTPKGVSIHLVDQGVDTGDIIAQKEITFGRESETLASTYAKLDDEMIKLFQEVWPSIKEGRYEARKKPDGGTFHKLSDKSKYMHLLTCGWDTPVNLLKGKAIHSK